MIRQEMPDTAILVLSAYAEAEHAMELLASGRRSRGPVSGRRAAACPAAP